MTPQAPKTAIEGSVLNTLHSCAYHVAIAIRAHANICPRIDRRCISISMSMYIGQLDF